jgi:poly(A) polymerase
MSKTKTIIPEIYNRDEHQISRSNIDADALKIMYRLNQNGFNGYLVGGGVRDLLLGKIPKDFDIATDATPKQIKNIFRNSRIIGKRFKLIHVYFNDNKIIEVATFRSENDDIGEDEETELLPKDNNYGDEQSDALRRDITINALFYDIKTFSVIDYVEGVKDLNNRIVRLIGEPNTRVQEDPVRMLRVARHAARAGFRIDERTEDALVKNSELLLQCPSMRIYEEVKKDLLSGHSLSILRLYKYYGMLHFILPELCIDNEALDNDESLLVQALRRSDLHQRISGSDMVSAALAIMAITLHPDMKIDKSFCDCFSDQEDLVDYLKSRFASYAVPRKERERLFEMLEYLTELEMYTFEELEKRHTPSEVAIKQLIVVLKCLETIPRQAEMMLYLKGIKKGKKRERYAHRRTRTSPLPQKTRRSRVTNKKSRS